jgi:hypothetical protein
MCLLQSLKFEHMHFVCLNIVNTCVLVITILECLIFGET